MKENRNFVTLRQEMVVSQLIGRDIKDDILIDSMKKIPRHLFVDKRYWDEAYSDYPLPIKMGQTISQPYIVALMTQELELAHDDRVLEIGTGSGYQTAILAEIAKDVFTVETICELLAEAEIVLGNLGYENIHYKNSNGYSGWFEEAPFDKIIVTAAPKEIPGLLTDQLKNNGIMIIPVGLPGQTQSLIKIIKSDNKLVKETICSVAFVPLIKEKF